MPRYNEPPTTREMEEWSCSEDGQESKVKKKTQVCMPSLIYKGELEYFNDDTDYIPVHTHAFRDWEMGRAVIFQIESNGDNKDIIIRMESETEVEEMYTCNTDKLVEVLKAVVRDLELHGDAKHGK